MGTGVGRQNPSRRVRVGQVNREGRNCRRNKCVERRGAKQGIERGTSNAWRDSRSVTKTQFHHLIAGYDHRWTCVACR
jgi:hypothetical protein